MKGYDNPGDMESLYDDGSDSTKPEEAPEKGAEDEVEGHTELISKKLLGGKEFKPGEEVVLKIVKDYGDQVEVKYATEKGGAEKPMHEMSEDEELDALSA